MRGEPSPRPGNLKEGKILFGAVNPVRPTNAPPRLPRSDDAAFPLFGLPEEAVELVLGFVHDREDKRALRLVCKRGRASVDSRVVAVNEGRGFGGEPVDERQLFALVRTGPPSRSCRLVGTAWATRARRPWRQRTGPPSRSWRSIPTAWVRRARRPWRQRTGPPSRCCR